MVLEDCWGDPEYLSKKILYFMFELGIRKGNLQNFVLICLVLITDHQIDKPKVAMEAFSYVGINIKES